MNDPNETPRRDLPDRRIVRRSRRRRPWLLIGCGVLTVLLLTCGGLAGTGLYYAGAFGPRWRAFDVPDGGCQVEVPAGPSRETIPGQADVTAYSARRYIPAQEWGIGYADAAAEPGPDAVDNGLTGMVRGVPGMTERTRGPVTTGGLPGRQVVADGPQGTMVARMIQAGNRLYILMAIGHDIDPTAPDVLRFFNSFRVTDQARLARVAAKVRQAAEGKAAHEKWLADQKAAQERAQQEFVAKAEAARKEYEQFEKTGSLGREVPDGSKLPGVKMYLPLQWDGGSSVRNAVDGRVYGAVREPARLGAGVRGTGLHLPTDTAGQYLPDVDGVQFGPDDPFTVAAWFRSRNGAEHGTVTVLRIGTQGGFGLTDQLAVELGQGQVRATLWAPKTDPKTPFPTPAATLTAPWDGDDGWHHLAVVRTPKDAGEVVEFYFDGLRTVQQFRDRRSDLYAARALHLGGGRAGSGTNFRGGIDEVYTIARALAEADVRRLAGLPAEVPPRPRAMSPADLPGLVFHLPFDDTDGRQVTDAVTKKPVGRVTGAIEILDGVRGRAARLTAEGKSGTSHAALALPDEKGKFEFAGNAPFTVATWVRAQPRRNAYPLSNPHFQFSVFEGAVRIEARGPSRERIQNVAVVQGPRPDGWFHVALTRTAAGELTLYVNGEPVKQSQPPPPKFTDPIRMAPGPEFGLAASAWDRHWCDLDEFCIYDRALSADEVKRLGTRPAAPAEKARGPGEKKDGVE